MSLLKNTPLLLLFACVIVGCGLRGPLYLPNDEQTSQPTTAQEARKAQKEEKEKEEENDGNRRF